MKQLAVRIPEYDLLRRDIDSADVRRVFPDLPLGNCARERLDYLYSCDMLAFSEIAAQYPNFEPPGLGSFTKNTQDASRVCQIVRYPSFFVARGMLPPASRASYSEEIHGLISRAWNDGLQEETWRQVRRDICSTCARALPVCYTNIYTILVTSATSGAKGEAWSNRTCLILLRDAMRIVADFWRDDARNDRL